MAVVDALVGAIACIGFPIVENTPSASTYASQISSEPQLVSGQRITPALPPLIDSSTNSELHDLFATNGQIKLDKAASNVIAVARRVADLMRGSFQPSSILANGGDSKTLAGPNGDIVNAGPGTNNEIFIPDGDTGTTIVVSPGSETIIGGNSRDQLVIPADRLWTSATGIPTGDSTSYDSSTLKLAGGWRLAADGNTVSEADSREIKNVQYGAELARYGLVVTYFPREDGDMQIEIKAVGPQHDGPTIMEATSGAAASEHMELWTAKLLLKNFHPGDFGLSFSTRASASNPTRRSRPNSRL